MVPPSATAQSATSTLPLANTLETGLPSSGSILVITLDEATQTSELRELNTQQPLTTCRERGCTITSVATARGMLAYAEFDGSQSRLMLRDRTGERELWTTSAEIEQLAFNGASDRLAFRTSYIADQAPAPAQDIYVQGLVAAAPELLLQGQTFISDLYWSGNAPLLLFSQAHIGTPPQNWTIEQLVASGDDTGAQITLAEGRLAAVAPDGSQWLILVEQLDQRFGLARFDPATQQRIDLPADAVEAAAWVDYQRSVALVRSGGDYVPLLIDTEQAAILPMPQFDLGVPYLVQGLADNVLVFNDNGVVRLDFSNAGPVLKRYEPLATTFKPAALMP